MKPITIITVVLTLMLGLILTACGGGSTAEPVQNNMTDLSSQQQAELVATALSANQGGVEDDIAGVSRAAAGDQELQTQTRNASLGWSVSVNIDFYDAQNELQQTYDPHTTDRIDYLSQIQGQITNGTGFFEELNIDNQSDFSVERILSRLALINGSHTNHSSYSRTQHLTQADVRYQLDSMLTLTEVVVDLDASDTFPESGTIEGSLEGSYERVAPAWEENHQFSFHFIATYLGDNTAEVELDDGTIFIVQLDSGSVQYQE